MKHTAALKWMIPLIFVLAAFAAGMGLFYQTGGEPFAYTSLRGEQGMINGRGLYFFDTVSSAAQMQANDLVALVLGLPLLAVSGWLALRGSLRGHLLLTGTMGFFLYTYMSMSFNTAYNALFLVYVALFSLSLIAFVLCLLSFDLSGLPARFSNQFPRRWIAWVMMVAGAFLLLAWVGGRVAPTFRPGSVPLLENTTTMVIQAMDLGLMVPLCMLGGILLLRRSAWGYLLSSVGVMKLLTMGFAVSGMGINMILQGVPDSPVVLGIFIGLTLVNVFLAFGLLRSVVPASATQMAQR